MLDSRRDRDSRAARGREDVVAGPPMTLAVGAMAAGLFVGALLAPETAPEGDVIEAGIAAVERVVAPRPE